MEPYCFLGYWCIAAKMTGYCVFECQQIGIIVGNFNSIDYTMWQYNVLYYWIQKCVILLQFCDTSNYTSKGLAGHVRDFA